MGARERPLPSGAGCLAPRIKLRDVILSGARPQLSPAVSELNPREVRIACPEQGRVSGRAERGPPEAACTLLARGLGAEGNRSRSGRTRYEAVHEPLATRGLGAKHQPLLTFPHPKKNVIPRGAPGTISPAAHEGSSPTRQCQPTGKTASYKDTTAHALGKFCFVSRHCFVSGPDFSRAEKAARRPGSASKRTSRSARQESGPSAHLQPQHQT
jgi:hypothetical protein